MRFDLNDLQLFVHILDSGTMTLHAGNREIPVCGSFTKRQAAMLRAGGLLNYTKEGND